MSLSEKLLAVQKAVTNIEKNGRNAHHGYDFAQHADVSREIRTALNDAGVIFTAAATSCERVGDLTTVYLRLGFQDGESLEERTHEWIGWGSDKQDKGGYKAYTGGIKYFLLDTFLLPTGDDPENDGGQKAQAAKPAAGPKKLTGPQLDKLKVKLTGADPLKLDLVLAKTGVDELAELTAPQANALVKELGL